MVIQAKVLAKKGGQRMAAKYELKTGISGCADARL